MPRALIFVRFQEGDVLVNIHDISAVRVQVYGASGKPAYYRIYLKGSLERIDINADEYAMLEKVIDKTCGIV